MPKLTCNGFSMFAQHHRLELEERLGRKFSGMDGDLIRAATPLWSQLTPQEKAAWKQKAKGYKKSDEYVERKRLSKARKSPTRTYKSHKDNENEYFPNSDEYDNCEIEFGVMLQPAAKATDGEQRSIQTQYHRHSVKEMQLMQADECVFGPRLLHFIKPLPHTEHQSRAADACALSTSLATMSLSNKRQEDAQKLIKFFKSATGGTLADIKRCRFVFLSMSAHGPLEDNVLLPAELSMQEFSLDKGIMDWCNRIVGPWKLSGAQLERAEFNAAETHKLPVADTTGVKEMPEYSYRLKEILREVLGRLEPGEAYRMGLRTGLYKNGVIEQSADDDKDELARYLLFGSASKYKNDQNGGGGSAGGSRIPLLPADVHGRRYVICLENQMETIINAMNFMMRKESMVYEGFPTNPDRFIFLDTFIETLASLVSADMNANYADLIQALQHPENNDLRTYWDKRAEMYCTFHRPTRNRWCAISVARRACFTVFHALRDAYDLPFCDYNE